MTTRHSRANAALRLNARSSRSSSVGPQRPHVRSARSEELRAVYGRRVDGLEWRARFAALEEAEKRKLVWWLTLTFEREVSTFESECAVRSWAGKVARDLLRQHVYIVWVTDHQPASGRLHVHALLGFDHMLPVGIEPLHARLLWERAPRHLGTSRCHNEAQTINATRRATAYTLLKHRDAMWSVACDRSGACKRRRRGCRDPAGVEWRNPKRA